MMLYFTVELLCDLYETEREYESSRSLYPLLRMRAAQQTAWHFYMDILGKNKDDALQESLELNSEMLQIFGKEMIETFYEWGIRNGLKRNPIRGDLY